ncbi:carbamoyltransferase family protein [Fluviicola taffensis]|uniref:Carbamoyltransferase n=1 Tax=Fluviicola taffensis (strain DSM 16823 / NCIMB 13979 / RW262) TaxID=755732 RepID=F2IF47_FLUTR|nr:carbamoyltransferase C-terminal domain-containing protein [Fluviicola taffensis]AEA43521.1 Carbamoyltransferase [Fluviicola taffensis DSM 16823]
MSKPLYVLGTGLSHNGSAVLLKDGVVCVGIEKERITRIKHDGGNDTDAIQYCLDAEGITLADIDLVVQTANFEIPDRERFQGKRLFTESENPPLVSISHHLAHAYSAVGTCHFEECVVMVIDGCGSPYQQCTDSSEGFFSPENLNQLSQDQLWCEKDSFYQFDGQKLTPLLKDFSPVERNLGNGLKLPTTTHSIGGFYAAISHYVFGNMDDVGKLMGLAPYGKAGVIEQEAFEFTKGSLLVRTDWQQYLKMPSTGYVFFKEHFQYYADLAFWAQKQVEKAVRWCFEDRLKRFPHKNVCYGGGVALNAVANTFLLDEGILENFYIEPAAGDNGLALGCAYYGWLEILKNQKVKHTENTCFGKSYSKEEIAAALAGTPKTWSIQHMEKDDLLAFVAKKLALGKTIGWFQDECEFGPRALGHRSILAHPGIRGLGDHINANIKFREDFRPFAPAVLPELAATYFRSGRKSPYMILVDQTKEEYMEQLQNVTHVNGTARVQTVDAHWNELFYKLIQKFHQETGIGVLLNTSFNKKGMPIVETPQQAIELFEESALDILVLNHTMIQKG